MNASLTPIGELLEQTKSAFQGIRSSTVAAMLLLAKVKEENAWTYVESSFGAYVEGELGVSQSYASKLLSVHQKYITEAGIRPEWLEGIDYEKCYIAAPLLKEGVSALEVLERARTLTRAELRAERVDSGHEHSGETVVIHKCCGMRKNDDSFNQI